ncbi:MAG: hypothetical protein LBQ27_02885 [Clostridiales bacterium]|jgi:hypothetical protein|nr:hypothetical protein [Clostridiales bacterium]
MGSVSGFLKAKRKDFIMFSFAFLFIILFFSMVLNYWGGDAAAKDFSAGMRISFAALVFLTVIFYQTLRFEESVKSGAYIVILNLFAALDLLLIFYGSNVNIFDIATTLYLVVGISAITRIISDLVKKNAKRNFYAYMNGLRACLIIMLAAIAAQAIADFANFGDGVLSPDALTSSYMFFAAAALGLQTAQILIVNKKNIASKIASAVMLVLGFFYGITLTPFFRDILNLRLSSDATVCIAVLFAVSVALLFCINLYRAGISRADGKRNIYKKSAVLSFLGFAMYLMFINGITDISAGTRKVFYIVSLALAAAFLVYILITYGYEKVLTDACAEGVKPVEGEQKTDDAEGENAKAPESAKTVENEASSESEANGYVGEAEATRTESKDDKRDKQTATDKAESSDILSQASQVKNSVNENTEVKD